MPQRTARTAPRRGFTLMELLLSLLIALVVLSSATAFTVSTWQTRRNWTIREGIDRNARFIGMVLARDAQEAGVAIESTPVFASIDARGDTLSILSVPYNPDEAPVYAIWNDGDTATYYPGDGNCGSHCIKFMKTNGTFRIGGGDVARLQVGGERRLVYLDNATDDGGNVFRVNIRQQQRLLGRQAGLSDSIRLARSGTSLQQLHAVIFWRDAATETLYRAQSFDAGGQPKGDAIGTGVESFAVRLIFLDGHEGTHYDGFDADTTNDGHRIIGVSVTAMLRAEQTDPAVNNGQPVRRQYEWRVAPRNLLYEKNRR